MTVNPRRHRYQAIQAAAARDARSDVARFREDPSTLAGLELGAFHATSLRGLLLRRFFLNNRFILKRHLPLYGLERAGERAGGEAWQRFLYQLYYWQSARDALADEDLFRRLERGPVILMYHAIGGPGERASRYVLPQRAFAQQMAWLAHSGYRVIRLADFLADRQAHRVPSARSVILTFDDGYADFSTRALPVLRRYRMPATVFLVSGAVGGTNCWDTGGPTAGRPLLTWDDARAMREEGIDFGSHTRSHALLAGKSPARLREEIAGSREQITHVLGEPPAALAYPGGSFDACAQAEAERAGYAGACGSHAGVNDPAIPRFALQRVEIQGVFGLLRFRAALWLGQARGLDRLWRGG